MAKGAFPLAAPTPNLANFVQPHQGVQRTAALPARPSYMLGGTKTLPSTDGTLLDPQNAESERH
eukprot:scaffold79129_cov63-Phaeocystis_antarctica.AAC.1